MISMYFILVSLVIVCLLVKSVIKPRKYPPGPKWYPFMGCSSIVDKLTKKHGSQWKGLSTLAKEFSTDVLGLKLGRELIVVVYGEKNIRHVFTEKQFEGRPDNFFVRMRCLGKRMDERIEEKRLKHLLDLLNSRSKAFSMAGGLLNQLPWCRFIFPELSGYGLIKRMNEQISNIIEEAISKHKNKSVKGNDFIYSFIEEMENNKESFTEEQLKIICLDVLIAGSQTTSNVLQFALLTVLRNKTIQDRLYEEISKTLEGKLPSWSDSYRLVYTSAFLYEVQRFYTIVPLMGPRRVLNDSIIDGYFIPKETTVLCSVGDLHFDPEIWKEPREFKPERFIDERGTLKNIEHLYPFGLGRRRCPGDALAKSFIFIVIVGILQKFKIDCSDGILPSADPIIGLISAPRPFSAVFTPRESK